MERQIAYEIVFKDILKLEKKNPIIDSLLGEIEVGRLSDESIKTFLDSSPSVKDLEIKQCLENLKEQKKKWEMREVISAIENLLQEENENEKNAMSDKLNALFP